MTVRCHHLDAYLDGRLADADAQAFEDHALACPACDAALAEPVAALRGLADVACPPTLLAEVLDGPEASEASPLFADGYRQLAAPTCPPEVIEAALKTARRAPDRAPRPTPTRRLSRRTVGWAAGLAVALALVVAWQAGGPSPAEGPATVAVAPTTDAVPPPDSAVGGPELAAPAPAAFPADLVAEVERQRPTEPAPAASPDRADPTPAEPVPDRPSRDVLPAQDLPAQNVAQAQPTGADPAEPTPTEAEIEGAQRDLALAFRLVADAQSQARSAVRDAVRDEAGALSTTLDRTLPF